MALTYFLSRSEEGDPAGRPFPLRRVFRRWLLPSLALFSALLIVTVTWGSATAFRDLYLEVAHQRALGMIRLFEAAAPDPWRTLLAAEDPGSVLADPKSAALLSAFRDAAGDLPSGRLTVLAPDGRILFDADDPAATGTKRDPDGIAALIQDRRPRFQEDRDPGRGGGLLSTDLDAVAVPIAHHHGPVEAILEFGVPMRRFEQIALRTGIVLGAVPALMLSLLLLALDRLVVMSQREIDRRTRALASARRALGRLVSRRAVELATAPAVPEGADGVRDPAPALLYADIRDFTGFAEQASPEAIAGLLNAFTNAVAAAVEARGGDVDKLIADGALARFEGPDQCWRALEAARDLLAGLDRLALPRGVGIGLFEGTARIVELGSGSRRDVTVVGDGVNCAARLCKLAGAGEIVAERAFLDGIDGASAFAPAEEVRIKGRREPLRIRRLSWPPSPTSVVYRHGR